MRANTNMLEQVSRKKKSDIATTDTKHGTKITAHTFNGEKLVQPTAKNA